jgi:glycosyltransferase involved in cell wall biosynthesis
MILSICVPTRDREDCILDMINSIKGKNLNQIELVIVDDSRSDETREIIEKNIDSEVNLNYMRESHDSFNKKFIEQVNGMDVGIAQAVLNANGKYCWLMSDDDAFAKGAIDQVLNTIKSENDLYIGNIFYCDKNLNKFGKSNFLAKSRIRNEFNIANPKIFEEYIECSTSNNALLSFMPAIIFKRANWIEYSHEPSNYVFGYHHIYKLFVPKNYKDTYTISYIDEPILLNRSFNDSYSRLGLYKRYLVDFEGYLQLSDELFNPEDNVKIKFIENMRKEHGFLRILKLRTATKNDEWSYITSLLIDYGYSSSFIFLINILNFSKLNNFLIPFLERVNSIHKKLKLKFMGIFNN